MSEDREQKNSVFAGAIPNVDPRIERISSAEKAKADFGIEIPIDTVPLPSRGKVYPSNNSLCGKDSVDIKAMTAKEEDILTSRALIKKGTVVTELIKSCLMDKSISVNDMLSGDRNAIMVAVRITGYGEDYDAEVQCNSCGTKYNQTFNLSTLPIKELSIEPVAPGMNLFEYVLPVSKKVVRFKFLTGRDEEDISQMTEKQKKLNLQSDNAITTNLLYAIVSVDGNNDRAAISNFVKNMRAMDSLSLRKYIRNNEPGIDMRQESECTSCGHQEEVSVPMGVTFLWPEAGR